MALFGIFGAEFLLHFLCDSKHAFDVVFASYDESSYSRRPVPAGIR